MRKVYQRNAEKASGKAKTAALLGEVALSFCISGFLFSPVCVILAASQKKGILPSPDTKTKRRLP